MYTSWLTEVDSSRFDEFLKTFWTAMRQAEQDLPESPPEGVGELATEQWPLSYVLDVSARFAAFRWYQRESGNAARRHLRLETFFLCPANAAPRLGLRILNTERSNEDLPAPAWWGESLGLPTATHSEIAFPGFMELAAILAANGNIATSSADTQAAAAELEFELSYHRQLNEEQAEELRQLRAKLREVLNAFATVDDIDEDEGPAAAVIEDLSGVPDWATRNGDRITVLPRALNGAKKSIYKSPAAVYAALELLAGPYREHRIGLIDKDAYSAALAKTGLKFEGSVGATTAGEEGDTYFVTWKGRRRFLEYHFLKGGGRDERYCLRVYFFWDEDAKQVVVGWLPSHLNNSLS